MEEENNQVIFSAFSFGFMAKQDYFTHFELAVNYKWGENRFPARKESLDHLQT